MVLYYFTVYDFSNDNVKYEKTFLVFSIFEVSEKSEKITNLFCNTYFKCFIYIRLVYLSEISFPSIFVLSLFFYYMLVIQILEYLSSFYK